MADQQVPIWSPEPPSSAGASGLVVGAGVILLVIATLLGLFGVLGLLGAAIMGDLSRISGPDSGLTPEQIDTLSSVGRTFIFVFAGVGLAIAAAHLMSGIGVLRRRSWARILGLVMSSLGVLLWLLVLASSAFAATQPIPAGLLEDSGLTIQEYRSLTAASWMVGMVLAAIGLAAYTFVLVVLISRGREFV